MTKLNALMAAVVSAMILVPAVACADAPPPVGSWYGVANDGETIRLIVQGDGQCMYQPSSAAPTVGTCTWNSSSPVGGILTLNYTNVFPAAMYYNIVFTGPGTMTLSDPYFRAQMQRGG